MYIFKLKSLNYCFSRKTRNITILQGYVHLKDGYSNVCLNLKYQFDRNRDNLQSGQPVQEIPTHSANGLSLVCCCGCCTHNYMFNGSLLVKRDFTNVCFSQNPFETLVC